MFPVTWLPQRLTPPPWLALFYEVGQNKINNADHRNQCFVYPVSGINVCHRMAQYHLGHNPILPRLNVPVNGREDDNLHPQVFIISAATESP